MREDRKELELYIHIPFCIRKCRYCDFLSSAADAATRHAYTEALIREIGAFSYPEEMDVKSIFIGGGTPSILDAEETERIMDAVRRRFDPDPSIEITMECNPGTLTAEKLQRYRKSGINRLSMGLQSADNEQLKMLGRIHTWEEFLRNYQDARDAGFTNLNVDLMSSLPGQTVASWEHTLEKVLALAPDHISAYSLIIEEGTPFWDLYHVADERRGDGKQQDLLPAEEQVVEMDAVTVRMLREAGLHRYEISNYARPGRESVHNSGYWTRVPYKAFGLGASSFMDHTRWKNTSDLNAYIHGNVQPEEVQTLSREDEIEETMFLGLRMTEGVDLAAFERTFGERAEKIYEAVIPELVAEKLIRIRDDRLALTARGMELGTPVMAKFLL